MFKQYNTIDDVMSFARDLVKEELNSTPLYVRAVQVMGYGEIGIQVIDNKGKSLSTYVSHNKVTGLIEEIVEEFEDPDIVVKVKEKTLLDILHNVERVKSHPLVSFFQYAPKFRPARAKDYAELLKLTVSVPKIFRKENGLVCSLK